jgi:hypothetical protein
MGHEFIATPEETLMSDNVVALVAIVTIFGLPMTAWIVFRAFRFVERLEMIKRGMIPPPEGPFGFGGRRAWREWQGQQPQQGGWNGPGCAVGPEDDPQFALYKGIRIASIGVALVIGLSFIGGTPGTPDFHYGPWLLGGLIPMFVGLAQIAIALLAGAQLPRRGSPPGFRPPPSPPPGGPATWQQPGRRLDELERPSPPPDIPRR